MPNIKLNHIYARSENRVIGKDGQIPWRLPNDFKHFKQTTMGCPIIMGRLTYEDHESALPGRLNLVVTRDAGYQAADGVELAGSVEAAIDRAKQEPSVEQAFIIGGVGLFEQTFDRVQTVFETVVHTEIEGDAVLPPFDFTGWSTTVLQEHPADGRHAFAFTVYRHDRPST